jgi:FkbH-like protein
MLKLVVWDLDETLLQGIWIEGDREVNPEAIALMTELNGRGTLHALATQNPPEVSARVGEALGWFDLFVRVEADLGPKHRKVRRILDDLAINPLDAVFVDEDPFERDSLAIQIPGLTTWSIAELVSYARGMDSGVTQESRRRPQMYREQAVRARAEGAADDYTEFLRSCNIRIAVRPYAPEDAKRVEELLSRTHQMNLGILPVEQAVERLNRPEEHHVIVAEMADAYGDMGRCGILHLRPDGDGEGVIESLAISCRTRARGLSLAMLVGMLRQAGANCSMYRCRYVSTGANRPLRMLLLAAGFEPQAGTDDLLLQADRLAALELPDWIHLAYSNLSGVRVGEARQASMSLPHQTPGALVPEEIVVQAAKAAAGEGRSLPGLDEPLLSSEAGFDSFALLEFVLRLEDAFSISIPDEDLDPEIFHSMRTIAAYLRKRLEAED